MNNKIFTIVLLVLSFFSFVKGQGDEKENLNSWVNYSSVEGKFSVSFPNEPKLSVVELNMAMGVRENNWFTVNQEGKQFAISYTDYQKLPKMNQKKLKENYDNLRDGITKQTNVKIITDKDIWLDEYFGRELVIEIGNEIVTNRIFLVNQRLYQAIVTMKDKNKNEEEIRKFLDSFKIKKKK